MNDIMTPSSSSTPSYIAKDSAYGEMTPLVRQFFSRLVKLPLGVWIGISVPKEGWASDPLLAQRSEDPEEAQARAKLRRIMDQMPVALSRAKRRVHDITDIAAGLTNEAVHAPMTRAAVTAVLALIARPYLSAHEFVRLYQPFAQLIPVEALEAGAHANRPVDRRTTSM